MTLAIKSVIVRLADGSRRKIVVGSGEGFFREEIIAGPEKSVVTHQCFIAGGVITELPKKETSE